MLNYPCVLDISYSVQKLDFVGLDLIHLHPEKSETPVPLYRRERRPGEVGPKTGKGICDYKEIPYEEIVIIRDNYCL
jgi:hypothetical protein